MTDLVIKSGIAEVNNTRLYYEEAGAGCPVILVHGDTQDRRTWDGQFEPLARKYRVVRFDLRGFGKSALLDETPFRHIDDIAALMDYLEIDNAHLIGQSTGCAIVCDFAAEYPDRVRGLVLVDPSPRQYLTGEAQIDHPLDDKLSKIKATALILVGEYDEPESHAAAEKLRSAIPRNAKLTLPFVGHLSNVQEPEMFNDVVLEFLAEVSCGCAGG